MASQFCISPSSVRSIIVRETMGHADEELSVSPEWNPNSLE
ncbi:MAG: hypothetical protein ABSB97_00505 [Thermoplasmata archaeon]